MLDLGHWSVRARENVFPTTPLLLRLTPLNMVVHLANLAGLLLLPARVPIGAWTAPASTTAASLWACRSVAGCSFRPWLVCCRGRPVS